MPVTYQFPLEEQNKYPGRITFQVMKTSGYGLSVDETQAAQGSGSLDNYDPRGRDQIPGNNGNTNDGFLDIFTDFKDIGLQIWNSQITQSTVSFGRSVELYMPPGIQVQDGVQFDNNVDFGIAGAGAFNNAGSVGGAIARLANPLSEINSLTEALKNSPNKGQAARVGAAALAQRAGPITGAVVSSALQTTTNPNTRAVFKSVPIREFTFSFKMLPQSMKEANEIVNIIDLFREEIYPETYSVNNTPIAYKFPNKFVTSITYDSKDTGIMILPSYLRAMSTTYNGSTQSFYRDGKFSEIDLSLTLVESRTLSRQDIQYGTTRTGETKNGTTIFDNLTFGG